jgi:hypothetical protein
LRGELAGRLAVEAHAEQVRTLLFQQDEVIGLGTANRGIEAAFTLAYGDHVPQADAVHLQPVQPLLVWQGKQVIMQHG